MPKETNKNGFEIKLNDLNETRKAAVGYMRNMKYQPTALAKSTEGKEGVMALFSSIMTNTESVETIDVTKDLIAIAQKFIPNTKFILTEKINQISLALQEGLAIALFVKASYEKATNFVTLQQQIQSKGKIVGEEAQKFNDIQQTSTAITLFTFASYVTYQLAGKGNTAFGKFQGIPEIFMLDNDKGISSVLYYYDKYLTTDQMISSEQDALDVTMTYFQYVMDHIIQLHGTLKITSPFTDVNFKLEKSEFAISGFERINASGATSVEFNKTEFEEIVGNREAKHLARRIVSAILSYCFKTQRNPYDAIAKYARVIMGYGFPGTGKSLLIAAVATELSERCKWLGIPFLFHPFPDNIVSTYQGGSAERAIDWFKPQSDPTRIIYAPIDDAENNLMDRSKDGVSAGVKEVIGVFLRMTEGAYSTNYGNSLIGLYTNRPEDIDKAVLSRIQKRAPIAGAVTHNDFFDQNYLWLDKHNKNLGDLVKMDEVTDYVAMSDQAKIVSISELIQTPDEIITHPVLRKVYTDVCNQYKKSNPHFYAALMYQMQKECKLFTSREARNIQTNIDTRMVDFDLPEIFWEKEEEYFLKTYDEKVNILKELMKSYMKGQSFEDIMLQESLKYMDTFIQINLSEEDREIQRYVDRLVIQMKGTERFEKLTGKKVA